MTSREQKEEWKIYNMPLSSLNKIRQDERNKAIDEFAEKIKEEIRKTVKVGIDERSLDILEIIDKLQIQIKQKNREMK